MKSGVRELMKTASMTNYCTEVLRMLGSKWYWMRRLCGSTM